MTRIAALIVLAAAAAGCLPLVARAPVREPPPPALRHLRVLHLNDVADLEALARAAAVVRAARGRLPRVLVTGGGDLLAPSAASLVLDAAPLADAWKAIGLAAATPGDRDLALPARTLEARISETGARWVSANLRAGGRPCCRTAPHVVLEVGDLRVGITGVTSEDAAAAASGDLEVRSPVAAARAAVAALRAEGAEAVLLLAHGEGPLLELLARAAMPDLVLGGHDGTPLGGTAGGVPVVRAGRGGRDVVQLDLWLDPGGRIVARDLRFLPVAGAGADPALVALLDRTARELAGAGPVGESRAPLDSRPEALGAGEAPLGNLLADLARRATAAEVALIDAGSLRSQLVPPGPVPALWPVDLFAGLGPLAVLELPGADLLATLEHALARLPAPASRFLQVSGVALAIDVEAPPGERLVSALVGGEPVDRSRRYRVVTTSRVAAGGDGYGWLRAARRVVAEDATPRLAALLVARLRQGDPLAPALEGRIAGRDDGEAPGRAVGSVR